MFHFTRSLANIKCIFEEDFYPHYCPEDLNLLDYTISKDRYQLVPMVSFCDIPLSQIKDHINNYGNYAIGLSKVWGVSKGISPVLYIHENSSLVNIHKDLTNLQLFAAFGDQKNYGQAMEILRKLVEIEYLIKPYKGMKWNNDHFDNKEIEFYNEREWRFTPNLNQLEENAFGLHHLAKEQNLLFTMKNLNDRIRYFEKRDLTNEVETFKLNFTPNDIKYIILDNENEIISFCDWLKNLKVKNFKPNELELLKTRILTIEQISKDF